MANQRSFQGYVVAAAMQKRSPRARGPGDNCPYPVPGSFANLPPDPPVYIMFITHVFAMALSAVHGSPLGEPARSTRRFRQRRETMLSNLAPARVPEGRKVVQGETVAALTSQKRHS